jgi:hypothetical protein
MEQHRSQHITGPPQCPRVDKPHPASIASTRLAVAGCAWKEVAQVVRNCSCVTDWDNRKFSQDILNGDDIKNGLSVVKLVYNLRANRFQPSCNTKLMSIISIIAIIIIIIQIIQIIDIIDIMQIITILRIVVCFQRRHESAIEGLGSSVCGSRG